MANSSQDQSSLSPQPNSALAPGRPAFEVAEIVLERFESAKRYAQQRRRAWRTGASVIYWLRLAVSLAATIVLGLANLGILGNIGFILSATVTTIAAIEPFFNWRSRWIMAEEALADWYRAQDALELYVSSTSEDALELEELRKFDLLHDQIWRRFSAGWIAERKNTDN